MKGLKPKSELDFSNRSSANFGLPLSSNVILYKELKLLSSQIEDIHKILLFSVVNTEVILDNPNTLSHIHNAYATWRLKNNIPTDYFMRSVGKAPG